MSDLQAVADVVAASRRLLVLTGAGCSTPSGIGDYRDAQGNWKRAEPIQHSAFVRSEATRQRYWLRSYHGWPSFRAASPNLAHEVLAQVPSLGLITQNVDRLHQRAGSDPVIDLHGRLDEVVCLGCGALSARDVMQRRLGEANPQFGRRSFQPAPDGDADLEASPEDIAAVRIPPCEACGGVLKPHVVFFGDGVPKPRVEEAYGWADTCDAMLVVGTSLMVFSGLRFCRRVAKRGVPLVLVNQGQTRADELFAHRVVGSCESLLPELRRRLAAA